MWVRVRSFPLQRTGISGAMKTASLAQGDDDEKELGTVTRRMKTDEEICVG